MSQNIKIAENINSTAEELRELADRTNNNEVLTAIAKNPNTPIDLLIELAGEFLDAIDKNPALDLILIENLNFIEDIYYKHFHEPNFDTYSEKWLPDWFLKRCLTHSDSKIRAFIARNIHTPISDLELLAEDDDADIKLGLASNKNTPVNILERLAEDDDNVIRETVAENKNTPVFLLKKLAEDGSSWVRLAVAENKNTPIDILELLVEDEDRYVKEAVAKNENTTRDILWELAKDNSVIEVVRDRLGFKEDYEFRNFSFYNKMLD